MKRAPRSPRAREYRGNAEDRKFYRTKRWAVLRELIIQSCGGLCVTCAKNHQYATATEVDHIIPVRVRPDLKWDPDNLQALCTKCHSMKTSKGQ